MIELNSLAEADSSRRLPTLDWRGLMKGILLGKIVFALGIENLRWDWLAEENKLFLQTILSYSISF